MYMIGYLTYVTKEVIDVTTVKHFENDVPIDNATGAVIERMTKVSKSINSFFDDFQKFEKTVFERFQ